MIKLEEALSRIIRVAEVDEHMEDTLQNIVVSLCVALKQMRKDHILLWEMYRQLNPIITKKDADNIKSNIDNMFNVNNSKIGL